MKRGIVAPNLLAVLALGLGASGSLVASRARGQPPTPPAPAVEEPEDVATTDGGVPPALAPRAEPAPKPAGAVADGGPRYVNTWDLNVEGGAGYVFGELEKWTGFGRIRPGVLAVRDTSFYQLGATAEYIGLLRRPAFGLQAEYLNLELGAWAQAGASIDTKARPGAMFAVGLSLFGIEAQVRQYDRGTDPALTLIAKIRVPVGILVHGLGTRK